MRHLVRSFRDNVGTRGSHFYNGEDCHFLQWKDVLVFLDNLETSDGDEFADRLLTTLSNYDPDTEFLAVRQDRDTVSVELYTENSRYEDKV